MPISHTFEQSLLLFLGAALVLYFGTRLLWSAVPWPGLWRGAIMSLPMMALALYHAPHSPGTGVAMLVSAAVLAMTLGLGVSTVDLPVEAADGSPMLRMLLPLAAVVCLCGLHGELNWLHAVAILVVGVLTFWTAVPAQQTARDSASPVMALPAGVLLVAGLGLLVWAVYLFTHSSGSPALTPVAVLLSVPATLLALLGLLSAESRSHRPDTPQETCTGLAMTSLGLGLPLLIAANQAWGAFAERVPAATQPATAPATEPASFGLVWQPVVMPMATWRVDSVLLVVVSILLLPIGQGRFKLGRAEGAFLIVLYLAYAAVATRTGTTAG